MNINLNQFIEIVRTRRSTRHFRSEPVAPELLQELLETINETFPPSFARY